MIAMFACLLYLASVVPGSASRMSSTHCYGDVKSSRHKTSHIFKFPRPKRDWLPCVARLDGRHTLLRCVPLSGTLPRALCLRGRIFRESKTPRLLCVVESFPGAQSPLGSKEPNELSLSPHTVFVV